MEIRWPFQALYLLILTHFINVQSTIILKNEEIVYALPGSDVTLRCSILKGKEIHITQTQWSKIQDGLPRRIAVYNPRYGTGCHETTYNYSVRFRKNIHHCLTHFNWTSIHNESTGNSLECNQWILQLRNIIPEMSGLYECSFTIFPTGTSSSEINLVIGKSVKPEISIGLQASFTGEANLICGVRKAFPKPNLLWYKDGELLKDKSKGISMKNEGAKTAGGFYEMRSLLTIQSTAWSSIHQAFKCMSVYPFPGNDVSSEEIVLPYGIQTTSFPLSKFSTQVIPVLDSSTERSQSTTLESLKVSSQGPPVNSLTERHSTKNLQDDTVTKLSSSSTVPQKLKASTTTPPKSSLPVTHLHEMKTRPQRNLSTRRVTEVTTLTTLDNPSTVKDWFNDTGNLSIRRVTEVTTLANPDHPSTVKNWLNNTGTATSPKHPGFSWPAVVATLLLFCTLIIILGVRKWCRHRKEIMNRPPSFKPPPPPVKYTAMMGCDEICLSCNELGNELEVFHNTELLHSVTFT
ncbi:T-cell surface protein tactile isoform X2 [Rhineura floridana]|uniref:T-cell surface protein tactile isoform X2 n=1 Tax=Rhineura floridana TaxID=261503 RepID=UPI002AC880E3|nr:T-cell surface protein tactile isoform X2 [Rhineura floridana]